MSELLRLKQFMYHDRVTKIKARPNLYAIIKEIKEQSQGETLRLTK